MTYLPTIFPAHPMAPEDIVYTSTTDQSAILRAVTSISRLRVRFAQQRDCAPKLTDIRLSKTPATKTSEPSTSAAA